VERGTILGYRYLIQLAKFRMKKESCEQTQISASTSTPPPPHHTVFASSDKCSGAAKRRQFGPPSYSPNLTRVLHSGNSSARSDIPYLDRLIRRSKEIEHISRISETQCGEFCYPERASRPSGDISVVSTQDECPENEATAPPGAVRTSCNTRRLSSEALNSNWNQVLEYFQCAEQVKEIRAYIGVRRPSQGTDGHCMRRESQGQRTGL
jgi:hypothetical protein